MLPDSNRLDPLSFFPPSIRGQLQLLFELRDGGRDAEAFALAGPIAAALRQANPVLAAFLVCHLNGWNGVTIYRESEEKDIHDEDTRFLSIRVGKRIVTTAAARGSSVSYSLR